jgi:hypothetical protein
VSFVWDSWGWGVVLYVMMMREFPFEAERLRLKKHLILYIPPEKSDGMEMKTYFFLSTSLIELSFLRACPFAVTSIANKYFKETNCAQYS